ncbi:MAG: hypothetical protein WEA31_06190 [Pirellulales bacterium]
MKRFYIVALIALMAASSVGCRGGRLAAMRDACLGRHHQECEPCNDCGTDAGIIYEGGPIYESAPPSGSYNSPSVTLPAPASYVAPSN